MEGLATHDDPESCGRGRKDAPEALTGAHAGRVLSREIDFQSQVPRLFPESKATPAAPPWQGAAGPGAVGDPEHAWKHSAREPGDPATAHGGGAVGRDGKSKRRESSMNGAGSLTVL